MLAEIAPERDFRTGGCDARCVVEAVLRPGVFGRSDLLVHSAEAHEAWGRRLGALCGDRGAAPVETGPLSIDVARARVALGGRALAPSPNELRLLLALAAEPDLVVPYPRIAAAALGPGALEVPRPAWMHALRSTVSRLRRRIGPAAGLVQAVPEHGLRLAVVPPDGPIPTLTDPAGRGLGGRWAREWGGCRCCGRTDLPHNGRGFCTGCHGQSCRGSHHHKETRRS